MKVKHLILSLAALWLGTACSNNEIDGGPDDPATAQAGEIQLIIGGSGESVDYTKTTTKGIASESENKIVDMTIYVFAGENEFEAADQLYLQEIWTSAVAADKATKKFTLQPSGSEWKASIYPNEWKTKPYLKFYCVANNKKMYNEKGVELTFKEVTLTNHENNNPDGAGVTTEDNFMECFSAQQTTDTNILTPLPMSGTGYAKVVGSVSKVKIELKRAVVRFDIDNTSRSSNFIIESVTMMNARKTAPLIDGTTVSNDASYLMLYKEVDFTQFDHANEGITESAIYVNPGIAADEPTLILKGQYISPTTGAPSAASYEVPIQRYNEAKKANEYIDLQRNNRYKLRIIDVTSATLKSTFEIEDWVNDGSIDTKPTDTKPTFVTFGADNAPTDMKDADKGILENTTFRLVNDATFTMDVKSSSKVNATLTQYDGQGIRWVELEDPIPAPVLTDDGYYTTTLTFITDDTRDKVQLPATVTLYNETSPNDPETQTVLTFYAPIAIPEVANQTPAVAFPETNTLNNKANEITITNQKNSYIAFLAGSTEGIDDVTVPDGFSLTKKEYTKMPYAWIYTLRITDPKKAAAVVDPKIELVNTLDNTKKRTLEINLKEFVSTISSADARAKVAADGLSIELDVAKMNADPTPVAAILHVPADSSFGSATGPDWLQSAGTGGNPDGSVNIQLSLKPGYTLTGTDDFGDNTFEIENSINGKTDIVTIKAVQNKPVIALSTGTGLGNSLDEVLANGDAQVALNIANGNHADFIITCEDGVKPTNIPEGLKVEDTGTGNLFTITIEDETKVTDSYSFYLTFENALYPLLCQNIEVAFLKVTP